MTATLRSNLYIKLAVPATAAFFALGPTRFELHARRPADSLAMARFHRPSEDEDDYEYSDLWVRENSLYDYESGSDDHVYEELRAATSGPEPSGRRASVRACASAAAVQPAARGRDRAAAAGTTVAAPAAAPARRSSSRASSRPPRAAADPPVLRPATRGSSGGAGAVAVGPPRPRAPPVLMLLRLAGRWRSARLRKRPRRPGVDRRTPTTERSFARPSRSWPPSTPGRRLPASGTRTPQRATSDWIAC